MFHTTKRKQVRDPVYLRLWKVIDRKYDYSYWSMSSDDETLADALKRIIKERRPWTVANKAAVRTKILANKAPKPVKPATEEMKYNTVVIYPEPEEPKTVHIPRFGFQLVPFCRL
ncbi:hypothetical protein SUGI_0309850 [Cryptomeria japonica]|nr:hypothetical protein SUGI_0309850 [Cryptomeria japonica]